MTFNDHILTLKAWQKICPLPRRFGFNIRWITQEKPWFRYYNSDLNTISTLTPYLRVGLNLDQKIATLTPHLDLGYSALITDIDIYGGDKGGFYSAIGLDCNFNLTEKIQLGLGANYSMTFIKIDFDYEGMIQHVFIPTKDDVMKALSMNLNLVYRF